MIVCLCKGVREKELLENIKKCNRVSDICKVCKAGTECGGCIKTIVSLLRKATNEKAGKEGT